MFIVVSYDIVDDKRRNKVHRALKDFGSPVQYSVFECLVSAAAFQRLKKRLAPLIAMKEDSIRFYVLCESCQEKIEIIGRGEVTTVKAFRIV